MEEDQHAYIETGLFQLAHCQTLSVQEKHQLLQAMEENPGAPPASLANRAGLKRTSRERYLSHDAEFNEETERKHLEEWGIRWMSILHPNFPELLKHIYDCPIGLFCLGDSKLLTKKALSVVGARSCTSYGKDALKRLLPGIIEEEVVIISGLARGIDTEAHRLAIAGNGKTVAVIGTGLDIVYPPENKQLQQLIGAHHLLVSEYPLGTKPLKSHFPMRNRIIAGLSMGTLVVEARYRSGSLITANSALNEGRHVFAVPGSILSPLSEGTNDLIKHGAKCVQAPKDIMEETLHFN